MIELLSMFFTGGGSAAMGSILKGVFGAIADGRESKHKLEMAREAARNETAIKFQSQLMGDDPQDARYVRTTRRILGVIGMCTLSIVTILCTIYPGVGITTVAQAATGGDSGGLSLLWGLVNFPDSTAPVAITTGHIAVFASTVVYPMIVGFYFTPGGRR